MLSIVKEDFSLQKLLDELYSMMQTQAQAEQVGLTCEIKIEHSDVCGDCIRLKQVLRCV